MVVSLGIHFANVWSNVDAMDNIFKYFISFTLTMMWIRFIKYARPFKSIGPFVVMLSSLASDVMRMLYLYAIICIPFFASFWIVFGKVGVAGYTLKNGEIIYNLFQMIVVGDFNYENLEQKDPIMARVLTAVFIFLSGIVCLNMFIAL